MISPTTITRLREAVDLQALAADYVKLQKAGSGWICKCPFHSEDTASCRVHKNRSYCFGGCAEKHKDAFDWIQHFDGVDFNIAARILSERTGIPLDAAKPVSRVAMQYAREEAELCKWWWVRYRARLRAELDAFMDEDDPLQWHQWRWLTWEPGPSEQEKAQSLAAMKEQTTYEVWLRKEKLARAFAFFREQVTAYERWLWREDQAFDQQLSAAWMKLAEL